MARDKLPFRIGTFNLWPLLSRRWIPSAANGHDTQRANTRIPDRPTAMADVEFVEGEQVLCYHGPLLYEAKVLSVSE